MSKHLLEVICCPFHEEKTPSMALHTDTDTFHCFGCGIDGVVHHPMPEQNKRRTLPDGRVLVVAKAS